VPVCTPLKTADAASEQLRIIHKMKKTVNAYKMLVGKSLVKWSLRRPRMRWNHSTKVDLRLSDATAETISYNNNN
jgi:hypothetical protein